MKVFSDLIWLGAFLPSTEDELRKIPMFLFLLRKIYTQEWKNHRSLKPTVGQHYLLDETAAWMQLLDLLDAWIQLQE
jgi:hypothetical protein